MARDPGLEELINAELADIPGVTQKAMFGGLAWLVHGNLLCGARKDSLLVRLGKGNDAGKAASRAIRQGTPHRPWLAAVSAGS